MRILIAHPSECLTDTRPHGDGLAAHAFITGLARRGHTVHVAVPGTSDLRHDVGPNVILHDVLRPGHAATGHRRPMFLLGLRALFQRLRRTEGIDVVHQLNPVNTGLCLALPAEASPLVLGPFVPRWEETEGSGCRRVIQSAKGGLRGPLLRAQERRADLLLLSTPAARDALGAPQMVAGRTRVLTYGVDADLFRPPSKAVSTQDILFLARVERYKGIFDLLDAFDSVADRVPSARLRIAGPGRDLPRVRERVPALRHASRVELVGPVAREEVAGLMASCAVYCLPSHAEPFGLTALEAMACGRPVVATDAGGLAHLVPGDGGRLVPPGDPERLSDALVELLSDAQLRVTMGRTNRALVERRYAWSVVIDELEGCYEEILSSPQP